MKHALRTLALLLLALLVATVTRAVAQERDEFGEPEERPDHGHRARPMLDPDYREKEGVEYPYLMSAPTINTEFGLFLNRSLVVETTKVPQNESSIAVNPLAPNVLLGSAVDERGAYVYISTDGGNTWRDTTFGNVNTNWRTGNDPSVGFDYEGNGYVMYGAFPSGNSTGESGVYLAKTTDNGATWTRHLVVIEHKGKMTKDSAFEDKYYVEIDNSTTSPRRGAMYTPWKRVIDRDSSTQIVVAHSTDRGLTWSVPVPVSPRKSGTSLDTTFGQSFPLTSTGPGGELYVVWNDGPIRSIGFSKSTDGGVTFTPATYPVQGYPTLGTPRLRSGSVYHVLKGTFRAETYPSMMVDNSNSARRGWIYLVWAAGRNPNIYFTRSTDGGQNWSTPKIIQSDTTNDQWWPWLSVDETNGDIAVMYSDSREDPDNILIDTYISYSRDGGDTWIDRRATDRQSDFRKNPYDGAIFAGDYSGNAFHNGRVYPSFLDTREDNDVYTALVNVRQLYPVENLVARGGAADLSSTTLTWAYPHPSESVYGYPVASYQFEVRRGGTLVATLPGTTFSYADAGLVADSTYRYDVRVVAGSESSIDRTVTYRASDALLPGRPAIVETNGYREQVELQVRVPTVRADSSTPLGNLRGYRLYRDGVLIREASLAESDTGRTVPIVDTVAKRGYYWYSISIVDGSNPARESARTDSVFTFGGPTTPYVEALDGEKPRFVYTGTWDITPALSLSPPNCLTDSPGADYLARKNTSLQIYPVTMAGPVDLRFAHIAIVDPSDTAAVEVSYDRGATWTRVRQYVMGDDPAWADRKADAGDWRQASITLTHPTPGPTAVGVARFRLVTGTFTNADGWYVDDISFGTPASVDAAAGAARTLTATVHPNPAHGAAIMEYTVPTTARVTVRVADLMGRTVALVADRTEEPGRHSLTISTQGLAAGTYFYEVRAGESVVRGSLVVME